MKKILTIISTFVFSSSLMAAASKTETIASVKTGAIAPDFSLMGADGKKHSLSEYKGKTVVLEWYNKDCPYVVKHYDSGTMQGLQKKYTAKDIVWLSVVSSAPGKQGHVDKAQLDKHVSGLKVKPSPTAVLFDPTGKVGKLYDAKTTPHMYIIGKDGKLHYQGAIDDKPSARQSSLKGATPLFANALDMVIAGKAVPEKLATNDAYGCSVKY